MTCGIRGSPTPARTASPKADLMNLSGHEDRRTLFDRGQPRSGDLAWLATRQRQEVRRAASWQVVAEFFDVGQSRSVPWERRAEASRLLEVLKRSDRGWDAVVVGEGTRCWYGNQFSLTAPKFAAYGVGLWVPELGGQFDQKNPSHKMLMSVLGGMSESERQHVQTRVRAAMDAQVLNEGRHQGGRPPYGYQVVDGGPHPNLRKSAEGYRLRVLVLDDSSAQVVRRIFAEYLDGHSDRAIVHGLNKDRVPCPSARWPDQNRHRLADVWQGGALASAGAPADRGCGDLHAGTAAATVPWRRRGCATRPRWNGSGYTGHGPPRCAGWCVVLRAAERCRERSSARPSRTTAAPHARSHQAQRHWRGIRGR